MTAVSVGEKKATATNDQAGAPQAEGSPRRFCSRPVIAALLVVVCTLGVTVSVCVVVVGRLTKEKGVNRNQEWVTWVRQAGDANIHELVLIDEKEETIMMVSAESYKINEDNSLALHDFQTGYVALRDFNANMCLVGPIEIPDFGNVKKTMESRQGKTLPLQTLKKARLTARNMTSEELGPRLSLFCEGVTARWFEISTKTEIKRSFADVPFRAACIAARLEF